MPLSRLPVGTPRLPRMSAGGSPSLDDAVQRSGRRGERNGAAVGKGHMPEGEHRRAARDERRGDDPDGEDADRDAEDDERGPTRRDWLEERRGRFGTVDAVRAPRCDGRGRRTVRRGHHGPMLPVATGPSWRVGPGYTPSTGPVVAAAACHRAGGATVPGEPERRTDPVALPPRPISRRALLGTAALAAGTALAGCGRDLAGSTPSTTRPATAGDRAGSASRPLRMWRSAPTCSPRSTTSWS